MNSIQCVIIKKSLEDWLARTLKSQNADNIILLKGYGTYKNKFLDFLGLEDTERVIALYSKTAIAQEKIILKIKQKLKQKDTGIFFELNSEMEENNMENFDIVITVANQVVIEEIINLTRTFGAKGGTIIPARGTGKEFATFMGMPIDSEKEILLTVTNTNITQSIVGQICYYLKQNQNASGICFSMPIQNFSGINTEK